MGTGLSKWWRRSARRRWPARRLWLERLEDRTLLSSDTFATALALPFTPFQTAHVGHFLSNPSEVDLYQIALNPRDRVQVAVSALTAGSGLQSRLRVFGPDHSQVALEDQEGGDPQLTFQAGAVGGVYFVGISSAGNDAYDPTTGRGETPGATTGLYTLDIRRTAEPTLLSDLTGGSFRLNQDSAAYGETISGTFTVENRGGADSTGFSVQVVLSSGTRFDGFDPRQTLPATFALGPPAVLAAGHAYTDQFTVQLPSTAPAKFSASGPVYIGLLITPSVPTTDGGVYDKSGVHRGEDFENLTIVTPASNGVTDLSKVDAKLNTRVDGMLSGPGQVNAYTFTVTSTMGTGRFTASVAATSGNLFPRLTLSTATAQVLNTVDGGAMVQNLTPGTYILAVSATAGAGGYRLTTGFLPASTALNPITVGSSPLSVALADVNGDGNLDFIVSNKSSKTVSVLLGNGDGTFQAQKTFAVGTAPYGVAVADVNGDGRPDIVVANAGSNTVSVLLGNGDGTFQAQKTFAVGSHPEGLTVADLNGDGKPDLIVANESGRTGGGTVSVLLGNGDGTFGAQKTFAVGTFPFSVVAADLNGDSIPDLVVANGRSIKGVSTVSVLLGNGDGTFQTQQTFAVGATPRSVVVADLNGDGKPDIVTANEYGGTLSVLLGNGDGSFQNQKTFAVGGEPDAVALVDANGDGKLDLAVVSKTSNTVGVLLGNGDGTFQAQKTFLTGIGHYAVAVGDLNGDGKPDIVTAVRGNTVSVLLGNGDGSFQGVSAVTVGRAPDSIAVADVNGDGKPDIVVANGYDKTVGVLLGNGDGSFQPQQTFALPSSPDALAVADLNGDGKPDIVVLDPGSGVSVLLGNGDGTFQAPHTFAVDHGATALAVADLNGDGKPDIVTANYTDSTVSVLLGNGDGTFGPQKTFAAGAEPDAVAVADLNGDGKPDIVVANNDFNYINRVSGSNSVSVLLGNGDGTFQPQQNFPVDDRSNAVAVADVNGDGKPDLVVNNHGSYNVSVLLGNGDGTFQNQQTFPVGYLAYAVAVADVNGDGKPDIAVVNSYGLVSVLLGNGDGTFQPRSTFAVGTRPSALAVADVNGDGKPDILVANGGSGTVSVRLGNGDGTFTSTTSLTAVDVRNTPSLADLSGHHDGTLDSVVLDSAGDILFRQRLGGLDFAPPVTINASVLNPQTGKAEEVVARDLAVLQTPTGWAVATADATPDPTVLASNHQFVYSVSLYTRGPNGQFKRTTAFSTPFLPTRIAAADLTGNGLDDLVVADSLNNSIQVAFQQPDGSFSAPITLPVGVAPSDLSLVDVNGDGRKDIVVTDQANGDAAVFLNEGNQSFAAAGRFRAATGLYGLGSSGGNPTVASLAISVSLAAGNFTGDGRNDLVVVNRGAHSFSVLPNDGTGGFAGPQASLTTSTSDGLNVNDQPGPVVAADFHSADGLDSHRAGKSDLAILMEDRGEVWIYTNRGDGTFTHTFSISAGSLPTGLTVVRNPTTGFFDLLVGNAFGDILRLQGQGDGTFKAPPPLTGSQVTLAVSGSGSQTRVLVANQQANHVLVETPATGNGQFTTTQTVAAPTTPFAFTDAHWFVLDQKTSTPDAVVVGSASNSLQINRLDAVTGNYVATDYAVGTDPVGVTIQDINGDGIPDMLVANKGSNDISVLFGGYDANGNWVGTPGPRLKAGGSGPLSVAVRDVTGPTGTGGPDGIPDLVVTNSQSNTMTVLPGVGQGFFNDQNPQSISLPGPPGNPSVNPSGIGVVPVGNQLIGFDLGNLAAGVQTVFTFREAVNAAQVLADGTVAVALADGTVEELLPDGSTVTFDSLTGTPLNPSDLEVLGSQVLVTSAGEDQVFVFAAPGVPEVALPAPPPPASPVAEATPPSEAPLTLVLTFVVAVVPAESSTPGSAAGEAQAAPATGFQFVSATTPGRSSGEVEEEGPVVPPPRSEATTDVDQDLRRLNLDGPAADGDPDGPSARLAPTLPGPWEAAVASRAANDLLPALPATLLVSLPSLAPQPAAARQVNETGRPTLDAPAPPATLEGVEPPARTGEATTTDVWRELCDAHLVVEPPVRTGDAVTATPAEAEEITPPSSIPPLAEQAFDAVFLNQSPTWDHNLAFLTVVALGGFLLDPGTGVALGVGRGGERPQGRRQERIPATPGPSRPPRRRFHD